MPFNFTIWHHLASVVRNYLCIKKKMTQLKGDLSSMLSAGDLLTDCFSHTHGAMKTDVYNDDIERIMTMNHYHISRWLWSHDFMQQRMKPLRDYLPSSSWPSGRSGAGILVTLAKLFTTTFLACNFLSFTNVFFSELFLVVNPSVTAKSYLCGYWMSEALPYLGFSSWHSIVTFNKLWWQIPSKTSV